MKIDAIQIFETKNDNINNEKIFSEKLYDTHSFCDECLNIIPAKVIRFDDRIYLYKK